MTTPNQERCLACSYQEGRGFIPKDVEHTCTQNHSTMEGWEEEFINRFVKHEIIAIPGTEKYKAKEQQLLQDALNFIRTLLAKERESAERRGRDLAIGYILQYIDNSTMDEAAIAELARVLEAARKDTDV